MVITQQVYWNSRVADGYRYLRYLIETRLRPDYLLVDNRAGLFISFSIINYALADTLVYAFSPNPENRDATDHIFEHLTALLDKRVQDDTDPQRLEKFGKFTVLPVVTRFPAEKLAQSSHASASHLIGDLVKKHGATLGFNSISPVHSDYDVELDEAVLRLRNPADLVRFDLEILDVMVVLFPEIVAAIRQGVPGLAVDAPDDEVLWRKLNQEKKLAINRSYKLFCEYPPSGKLVNLDDNARNVSLAQETFLDLLEVIPLDLLKSRMRTRGINFGKALRSRLLQQHPTMGVDELISEWCVFDTSVGFGLFQYTRSQTPKKIRLLTPCTYEDPPVRETGLAPRNISAFMEGYVNGALGGLLNLDGELVLEFRTDFDTEMNPLYSFTLAL